MKYILLLLFSIGLYSQAGIPDYEPKVHLLFYLNSKPVTIAIFYDYKKSAMDNCLEYKKYWYKNYPKFRKKKLYCSVIKTIKVRKPDDNNSPDDFVYR